MSSQNQEIAHQTPERKYFTMMLNMADDDLNPYQYRLLAHYTRVAGQGGLCNEGVRTTAKTTRMGVNKVQSTRSELEQLGYIRVSIPDQEAARKGETVKITIVDRWGENVTRYQSKPALKETQAIPPPVSNSTQVDLQAVSNPTHYASEPVSNQIRKNNGEENLESKTNDSAIAVEQIVSPKGEKAWADMSEGQRVGSIIKVYLDANKIIVSKTPHYNKKGERVKDSPYDKPYNRTPALTLIENGITAKDLQDFFDEKRDDGFWDGRAIEWPHILKNIGIWKDTNDALATPSGSYNIPEPQPQWTVPEEDRVTPEQMQFLREKMSLMGRGGVKS